jgi:hypothetical protein
MAGSRAYTAVLDAPDWAILGTYLTAVLILVAVTKGRRGVDQSPMVAAGAGTEGARRKSGR